MKFAYDRTFIPLNRAKSVSKNVPFLTHAVSETELSEIKL